MKILDRILGTQQLENEQRSYVNTFFNSSAFRIYGANKVTKSEALQIPSFANALQKIVNSASAIDVNLYQKTDKGLEILTDDRINLINNASNSFDVNLKGKLLENLLLFGQSHAFLERDQNFNVIGLHYIQNVSKKEFRDSRGIIRNVTYDFTLNDTRITNESYINILELSTYDGLGVLTRSGDVISDILAEQSALKQSIEDSITIKGVLKTEGRLSQSTIESLKEGMSRFTRRGSSEKVIVLEEGLSYQTLNNDSDNEILSLASDMHNTAKERIASIFGLSSDMLDGKNYSLSNSNGHFFEISIKPLLISMVKALNSIMLTEEEKKQGYVFQYDTSDYPFISVETATDIQLNLFNNGVISLNELRQNLKMNRVDEDSNYKLLSIGKVMEKTNGELINLNIMNNNNESNNIESNKDSEASEDNESSKEVKENKENE